MKKIRLAQLLTAIAIIAGGCSKDNKPDCEEGNYGVFTVNFGTANVSHGMVISSPGGAFRDKIVPIGKSSDTVHLFPGDYPIEISSRNANNQAIQSQVKLVTIATCDNQVTSVPF